MFPKQKNQITYLNSSVIYIYKYQRIRLQDGIILVSFLASLSGRSYVQKQILNDMFVANRQSGEEFMPYLDWSMVMLNIVILNNINHTKI